MCSVEQPANYCLKILFIIDTDIVLFVISDASRKVAMAVIVTSNQSADSGNQSEANNEQPGVKTFYLMLL